MRLTGLLSTSLCLHSLSYYQKRWLVTKLLYIRFEATKIKNHLLQGLPRLKELMDSSQATRCQKWESMS